MATELSTTNARDVTVCPCSNAICLVPSWIPELVATSASAMSLLRLDRNKPKVPINGYWDGHGHGTLPFHGKPCSAIDDKWCARKKRNFFHQKKTSREENSKTSQDTRWCPLSSPGEGGLQVQAYECTHVHCRYGMTLHMLMRSVIPGRSSMVSVPFTWACSML